MQLTGVEGRHEFMSLKDAVTNHPDVMRKISPAMIDQSGINLNKNVEINENKKNLCLLTCRMMCCIIYQLKVK